MEAILSRPQCVEGSGYFSASIYGGVRIFLNMRYPSSDDSSAVSGFSVGVCRVLDISIDIFIASLHVFLPRSP